LLKAASVGPNSHVVDFGSGLGRILFAAAYLGAESCVGCEFDKDLVISSRQNCARSRYGNKVRIEHCDATIFKIPLESNAIFFFNPFGSGIMTKAIGNLEQSLLAHPRKMEVVYFNPSFNNALESSRVFSLRDQWPEIKGKRYAAEFWSYQP
jgi:predicted RNA methylase